jgi:hypothetical protein
MLQLIFTRSIAVFCSWQAHLEGNTAVLGFDFTLRGLG